MDGTFTVECEGGPGGRRESFAGLAWKAAEARCEAERVKLWETVVIRCEGTGAAIYTYPGTAALPARAAKQAR